LTPTIYVEHGPHQQFIPIEPRDGVKFILTNGAIMPPIHFHQTRDTGPVDPDNLQQLRTQRGERKHPITLGTRNFIILRLVPLMHGDTEPVRVERHLLLNQNWVDNISPFARVHVIFMKRILCPEFGSAA
jgi:hypothetical protein